MGTMLYNFQAMGSPIIPLPEKSVDGRCSVDVYGGDTFFATVPDQNWWITANPFLPGFEGNVVFPDEYNSYVDTETGNTFQVPCFDVTKIDLGCIKSVRPSCENIEGEDNKFLPAFDLCVGENACDQGILDQCAIDVCPEYLTEWDGTTVCAQPCLGPCPYPFYDEEEYRMQWAFYVVPALVSLPMNAYIFGGFWFGRKGAHKKSRPAVQIAVFLALAWTLVDAIPSALLYTDTYCQGDYSFSRGETTWCHFSRGTIHIVQSMYYWIVAAILDLYLAVVKEKTLRDRDNTHKKMLVFCFGVPVLMLILTYALQIRDAELIHSQTVDYSNKEWNNSKDSFTCSPRFENILTEVCVVYIHFVLGGVAMVMLLAPIITSLISSAKKIGGGDKESGALARTIKKSGAKKLIYLGMVSTVLLVLNLLVIATTVPKVDDFKEQKWLERECQVTATVQYAGEACQGDNSCCDHLNPVTLGMAPSAVVIALGYYFAVSAIPLTLGAIFSGDKKHREGWMTTKAGAAMLNSVGISNTKNSAADSSMASGQSSSAS
jgi:hypothetical protein